MQQNERDLFGEYSPQFNKDRIKQARELAGLTQQELAENIGVQQAWIAKPEKLQPRSLTDLGRIDVQMGERGNNCC